MTEMDVQRRFGGVVRLYGEAGLRSLQQSHVMIVGIGGVGSWAAEALARNAVGHLTLVDLDNVAESNVNRQVHAVDGEFGLAKVAAMAKRIDGINPAIKLTTIEDFVSPDNIHDYLSQQPLNAVLDCTDDAKAKVALAAYCLQQQVSFWMSGSAGGRLDPTRIQVDDLALVQGDKLLAKVRQQLRKQHGFPAGSQQKKSKRMQVNCVFSSEIMRKPSAVCAADDAGITGLNCAGYGSSVSVTATFGFTLAQLAINEVVGS